MIILLKAPLLSYFIMNFLIIMFLILRYKFFYRSRHGILNISAYFSVAFDFSYFFACYFMHLYCLIPSVIIRLLNRKPLSRMAWVVCIAPVFVFISCYVMAYMARGVMWLVEIYAIIMPQAIIASYFVLKFPARNRGR